MKDYVFDPSRPQDQRRYEKLKRINDATAVGGIFAFVLIPPLAVAVQLMVFPGADFTMEKLAWSLAAVIPFAIALYIGHRLTLVKPDRSFMVDRWHLRDYVDVPADPIVEWEVADRERVAAEMMDVASRRYMGKHLTESEERDYDLVKNEVASERVLIAQYVQKAREERLAGS